MDPLKVPASQETKLHFLDYWRIIRIRKTVILAVFLLVVITATLVTFILPESYSSKARIDSPDISGIAKRMPTAGYDPYFIQTEFETIQSERVLGKVIDKLELNDDWGKKYHGGVKLKTPDTIVMLKGRMDLRPVRNTKFIEIVVYSENKDEAARLANAIAEAYQEHRQEQREKLSQGGIDAMEKRLKEQEEKVAKKAEEVEKLREELQVPDSMSLEAAPVQLLSAETIHKVESLRIENEADFVKQSTLLNKLKSLKYQELTQVLPTTVADSLLSSLLEQKNMTEQALVIRQKEYGDKHVEVIKLQRQLDDLQDKIAKRVEGIITSLEARVAAVQTNLALLQAQVDKATANDIGNSKRWRPYFDKKRELDEQQRFRQILTMKIASEKIDQKLPKTLMVEIMDKAEPGTKPVKPNKALNIALGIIIGLVVGIGLAFFIEYLDTSVKTIDDVERSLQSPVLGVIPQNVGLILDEGVDSPHAEAYRVLRTNLLFSRKDDKLNSVAVVSAGAGEGKSTTVFNLACVFAQSRQRVLIVDSDLRRPTLHKMLRVPNDLGLTNYLLKQNSLEDVIRTTPLPTLDFLASGKLPSSSLGILSSAQMKELINELKQRYDFVFFDSPPIMGVSDASILASEVDMTLQVIQYRRYPQPMNVRAKQLIEKVGGNLVGIVLNNINMSQDESYYYYSGYYHDYYSVNEDQESAARPDEPAGDKARRA
ncbi:MAG: capsular biosynthesis protein [Verrucomicrobia bacterium]|nr:MAG: capsular biosynthesis protein [Verrucomicrobiota bacterium]